MAIDEAAALPQSRSSNGHWLTHMKCEETAQLETLISTCETFVTGVTTADASLPSTFDWVASRMHGINHCVFEAELAGVARDAILATLSQVRSIQAQSPFVSRLQNWPRGYPGDFETIEYLMESTNRSEPGTVAFWIEKYCLTTAIAQQHRNKVRWQADHVERVIKEGVKTGKPARILLLACGSSPDVRMCLSRIVDHDFQIVLNDMDDGALEFSAENLSPLGERVKIISGNMFRAINRFAGHGPFDLVLAGGLFDYLKDDQATFLIKAITSKLLSPTGTFAFTNIAKPNPYKYWMEYCANWFLIERESSEIQQLCLKSGIDLKDVSFTRDVTQMTNLIAISNCGGRYETS